jgi:acetylornithine deacetylase/succinyl-diaminopimelate desuccinylase-like protein
MTPARPATTNGHVSVAPRSALGGALAVAAERRRARLAELKRWLAIPSVSSDPARADAVREAAAFLSDRLGAVGADVEELSTPGGPPVVVGRAGGPPAAPVVLVYGHYDVQPPGPGWTTDPFTPTTRDGVLYARGANDDKGQLFAHLAALDAWRQAGGPPVTVVIVAEGAEEVGSRGFAEALSALRHRTGPNAVVVSDTERASLGRPAVTVSQRGQITLRITVDTGGPAMHAGRLGGRWSIRRWRWPLRCSTSRTPQVAGAGAPGGGRGSAWLASATRASEPWPLAARPWMVTCTGASAWVHR